MDHGPIKIQDFSQRIPSSLLSRRICSRKRHSNNMKTSSLSSLLLGAVVVLLSAWRWGDTGGYYSYALEDPETTVNATINYSVSYAPKESYDTEHCSDDPLLNWNASNVQQVIQAWKFNQTEQDHLEEFQHRIADVHHWKNDPAEAARFLKEHVFDVAKAERMFRGMLDWRQTLQIDAVLHEYGEPPAVFQYAPIFLLKGLDHEQDPIFVQRLGRIDGGGLYHSLGGPAMVQAFRFVSELQTSRACGIREDWQWQRRYYEPLVGRRMIQLTILVDLEGLSVRVLRPALLGIVQETARVAQDHYPGLAKRIIVIRAPKVFQMAWNIAKHFYDPRVHHKFVFAEQDEYLQVLSQYMDLDVLPSVIYEHGHGQPMSDSWFEKVHMEGGRIPALHEKRNKKSTHKKEEEEPNDETCEASVADRSSPLSVDLKESN